MPYDSSALEYKKRSDIDGSKNKKNQTQKNYVCYCGVILKNTIVLVIIIINDITCTLYWYFEQ